MRTTIALALSAALLFAACGGDDDDTDTDSEPASDTTSDADESAGDLLDDDAFTDALAASFSNDTSGYGATEAEGRCAAERAVAEVGAARMQEAGITAERLEAGGTGEPTDLTETEAGQLADAIIECIDLETALASTFAGGEDTLSPEQAACVADELGDAQLFRALLVQSMIQGEGATFSRDLAEGFADVLIACIDIVDEIVADLAANDTQVTPDQRACLEASLPGNDAYRESVIAGLTGDEGDGPNDEIRRVVADCVSAPGA